MYNVLDENMEAGAGIKLRVSMCPPDVADLGTVWIPEGNKNLGSQ